MTAADRGTGRPPAPTTYHELFEYYYDYALSLVRTVGVDPQHAYDVAGEVLLKFMDLERLEEFDPNMRLRYQGVLKATNFKSFLSRFVLSKSKGQRDKYLRRLRREGSSVDDAVESGALDHLHTAGPEELFFLRAEYADLITGLREHLATVPPRSRYEMCDLVALFDAIVAEVEETGTYTVDSLATQFGVSVTAIYSWRRRLREQAAIHLGLPVDPKPPRRTPAPS